LLCNHRLPCTGIGEKQRRPTTDRQKASACSRPEEGTSPELVVPVFSIPPTAYLAIHPGMMVATANGHMSVGTARRGSVGPIVLSTRNGAVCTGTKNSNNRTYKTACHLIDVTKLT